MARKRREKVPLPEGWQFDVPAGAYERAFARIQKKRQTEDAFPRLERAYELLLFETLLGMAHERRDEMPDVRKRTR